VDVGGEGYDPFPGGHGFSTAFNMNDKTMNYSYIKGMPIPFLLFVQEWQEWDTTWKDVSDEAKKSFTYQKMYPFENKTVDRFYMQSAPFEEYHAYEMARCIRDNGEIRLDVLNKYESNVKRLAGLLHTQFQAAPLDNEFTTYTIKYDKGPDLLS
jgi:hypothetical protein